MIKPSPTNDQTTMQRPINSRALMLRLNRKLAHDGRKIFKARSESERHRLGAYFVADAKAGSVVESGIADLEAYARTLSVLKDFETLED